jgi:DNA-binding MarR family transcriptional regulator
MNDEIRPPSLLALPSYLAGNVARIGHRFLLDGLAEHDLRLPHAAILAALSDFGPLAQYELADCLDVQRSHLVGHVDLLEQRGLVQRERDTEDRRRQNVALTKSGRALWQRLQRVAEVSQAQFLDVLSDSERQTLLTLLSRVLRAHDEARLQGVGESTSRAEQNDRLPAISPARRSGSERTSR